MYTFKELYNLYNEGKQIKFPTVNGYTNVTGAYRKFGAGRSIIFNDGTEITGSDFHLIFNGNDFVIFKSLSVGDELPGQIENKTIKYINIIKDQYWYDFSVDSEDETYLQNGLIHHNSGKSLILYSIIRYLMSNTEKDILLIVPSVSLLHQMSSDFDNYYNADFQSKYIHKIFSGQDKNSNKRITVTTWQSVFKQPKSFFSKFGACLNDECHLAKASSITAILNKMTDCKYKIGCTGTLEDSLISVLQIVGLFGPVYNAISTKALMDKGLVAQLTINNIILEYPEEVRKLSTKLKYQEEVKYTTNHKNRNNLIAKVIKMQPNNTLFLANNVSHVKEMFEMVTKLLEGSGRKVYIATGATDALKREEMRHKVENEIGSVICATYGVLSTGFSLKNLYTVIFGSATKSKIRTLQSIGRGLRTSKVKNKVTLYDFIDDLSWKRHKNYGLKHFVERMKMYTKEKFDYTINKISL